MKRIPYPEPITRNASHCEADGCNTWSFAPEAHGFIEVVWGEDHTVYCTPDCLLRDIAQRTAPTTVIPT